MATLQSSLMSLPFSFPTHSQLRVRHSPFSFPHLSFNPLSPYLSNLHLTRFCPRVLSTRFNSQPEPNPNPSEPDFGSSNKEPDVNTVDTENVNLKEEIAVSVSDSRFEGISTQDSETVLLQSGVAELDLAAKPKSEGNGANFGEKKIQDGVDRLPIMVFFVGLWVRVIENVKRAFSEFLDWWPFWRQEKRLARLIVEADANPLDAAKQSVLFVEFNKHSPEAVIKRFEQRDCAVDSRGIAEYLRALVVTNAIAEYLPDEESGKPSGLPTLENTICDCFNQNASLMSDSWSW